MNVCGKDGPTQILAWPARGRIMQSATSVIACKLMFTLVGGGGRETLVACFLWYQLHSCMANHHGVDECDVLKRNAKCPISQLWVMFFEHVVPSAFKTAEPEVCWGSLHHKQKSLGMPKNKLFSLKTKLLQVIAKGLKERDWGGNLEMAKEQTLWVWRKLVHALPSAKIVYWI